MSPRVRFKLPNLFTDPEHGEAARNLAWLLADRVIRLVLTVGVGFLVARHLGPQRFGTLSFALASVAVLQPLAEMGLEAVLRRKFIQDRGAAPTAAATAGLMRIAGGGIAACLLLASLSLGWAEPGEGVLIAVLALTLLQPAWAVPEIWQQARLAARSTVTAQWIALGAGAGARLAMIAANAPLVSFAWVVVAESVAGAFLVGIGACRGGFRLGGWNAACARSLWRDGWPLLLSGFAALLYMRIDVLMLRRMVDADAAGLYAAATRFTELWYFLPGAIGASLLPALLRARGAGTAQYDRRLQAYYDLNAGIGYVLAALMALPAAWLVRTAYGPAFAGGSGVLTLHAWSLVFVFLGVARGQFLINERHTWFYFASTGSGLVCNVALNFALIPRYGAWGAALATLVAQATAAWGSTFCFAPARGNAWMQTRALLIPLRWHRYVSPA